MSSFQSAGGFRRIDRRVGVVIVAATLGLLAGGAWDRAAAQGGEVGTAQNAVGSLLVVRRDGIEERLSGKGALRLFEGDVLRTDGTSRALIELTGGVQLALNANTTLRILARWEKANGLTRIIRLRQGEIWTRTGAGARSLEVETPVAVAVLAESEVGVKSQEDGRTVLTVVQGVAELETPFGVCRLNPSAMSSTTRGKPCTNPEFTDARAAIAWTEAVRR